MSIETRKKQILSSMQSFSKEKYRRDELLEEMLRLQKEMVTLTFSEEHATNADLRIYDVERYLERLCFEYGESAEQLYRKYCEESREFCDLLIREITGRAGEKRTFRVLEELRELNRVVRNVELQNENLQSEIDAVVLTKAGITIVEVKNTKKDIFIGETGDYYRVGRFLRLDSHLGVKLDIREKLLSGIVHSTLGRDIPIQRIVVFTNNGIEVENQCERIRTCFLEQLPYAIEQWSTDAEFSEEEIENVARAIEASAMSNEYGLSFDVEQYKEDFALLVATLEECSERFKEEEVIDIVRESTTTQEETLKTEKKRTGVVKGVIGAVAAAAIGLVVLVLKDSKK